MKKISISVLTLLTPLIYSCGGDSMTNVDLDDFTNSASKLISVNINGSASDTTKADYTASDDKSTFNFSWSADDDISLYVPNTENNDNQLFTAESSASSSTFSGELMTWDGAMTVCAIFPYTSDGYAISDYSFRHSVVGQKVDASSSNSFENGLMVSFAEDATATSESDYSISTLSFKQVMSFYHLELTDIPSGEEVVEIGFEGDGNIFIDEANVDIFTAEINSATFTSKISASVSGATSTTATIDFALFPVDLSSSAVTLYVITSSNEGSKLYTKIFDAGVNFLRNSFIYNSEGALSLTSDLTLNLSSEVSLADISALAYPSDDLWVITDATAEMADFVGIKAALAEIYSLDSSRRVSLEFPNLVAFPDEALINSLSVKSLSAPVATALGYGSLSGCTSLTSLLFATSEGVMIDSLGDKLFDVGESGSQSESITLTIGYQNNSFVYGNTLQYVDENATEVSDEELKEYLLTVLGYDVDINSLSEEDKASLKSIYFPNASKSFSYTFKKIIYDGTISNALAATGENASGIKW